MATIEIIEGQVHKIQWRKTGQIITGEGCKKWKEIAQGLDQYGNVWIGLGLISCGVLLEIFDAEIF